MSLFKRFYYIIHRNYGKIKSSLVLPEDVSPSLEVPESIQKPSYWQSGHVDNPLEEPVKKSLEQLEKIRTSCRLANNILDQLHDFIKVGISTDDIDKKVHKLCVQSDSYPSPLNYHNFPKSCCTSVNNVACHGIPDSRKLHDGDIINVDVTVYKDGMHGDCSRMYLVGDVDDDGKHLCRVTKEALEVGIKVCAPGVPFSLIGESIEDYVKRQGLTVIPCFLGHGIGSDFHEMPEIYHHRCKMSVGNMEPGHVFTIEPAVGEGRQDVIILEDGWTAVTLDNSRSAQYEATVHINDHGYEVLTK